MVSCEKDDVSENIKVKGAIVGYHKCTDSENEELVFGVYIVTEKKHSILAYNIPHETLNSILDVDIYEQLSYGAYPWGHGSLVDNSRVIFDYRKAKAEEIVNIHCLQFAMLPGFNGEGFEQVIISNINKEE
jgi:hypothetical protein